MTSEEVHAKLSGLPDPEKVEADWSGYVELGFQKPEVEELLTLISDYYLNLQQTSEESALSIHAWRALAAMGDLELIPELINLSFECDLLDDDWFSADLGKLMSYFGMKALPQLLKAVRDHPRSHLAMDFSEAVVHMVNGEEDRKEALEVLVGLLGEEQFERDFRAFVVTALIDLEAVEEIDTIRELFERNRVNISIVGDLEEVEVELGVRELRSSPRKDLQKEENRLARQEKEELAGPFPKEGSLVEKLQYFLIRYGTLDSIHAVDQLDGFFLALVISGVELTDRKRSNLVWSPNVLGQGAVIDFATPKEKAEWLKCLREFWEQIEQGLETGSYEPHLSIWPDAAESMDPEVPFFTPWLSGFLAGDSLTREQEEEDDFEEGASLGFLAFAIIEQEEEGLRLLEDSEDNPFFAFMAAVQERYDERESRSWEDLALDESALDFGSGFTEFPPLTPAPAKKVKIERNEPCPCGSGRKYKKCCMN